MTNLLDFLADLKKTTTGRFYFRPNTGNAGDSIIAMGSMRILADCGIDYTFVTSKEEIDRLTDKDVLILGGGGYLVPYWHGGAVFLNQISDRKCKLVLLPQSVLDAEEPLRLLREGDAIFLRGRNSYDYAKSLDLAAFVSMDDDCGFSADAQAVLNHRPLGPRSLRDTARYALIGYHYVRSKFTGHIDAYRVDGEKLGSARSPVIHDIARVVCFGNSDPERIATSAHWLLRVLSWYDTATTDRLHVMVSRILIKRPVQVRPISYTKIQEVIDLSIKGHKDREPYVDFKEW